MQNSLITVHPITDAADLRACQEIQRRAWGITTDGYLLPVATMVAVQKYGGLVVGAWRDETLIGFSFAFLGKLRGQTILYSQLTAVLPGVQGGGVGYQLKMAQRDWAQTQGLPRIVWAFDPMQAGNAHFNIARLGAYCRAYEENMYGERRDALNAGLATDRLIAEWPTSPLARSELSTHIAIDDCHSLITTQQAAAGAYQAITFNAAIPSDAKPLCVEIPESVGALVAGAEDAAIYWQSAVRETLTAAFANGYAITDFIRQNVAGGQRCWYVLTHQPTAPIPHKP